MSNFPLFQAFLLAMLYAYPAVLGIVSFRKYRDWPSLAMVPSLVWMSLYFTVAPYTPVETNILWGRLAFMALSASILLNMFWRYSTMRNRTWTR